MTGNCEGKKVFHSYWRATRSAKLLNRIASDAHANAYKCKDCNTFHVGNTLNGKKPRNRHRKDDIEEIL